MKATHKISITTGTISGLTTAVILVGSMLGWNLTDKVAMIGGVLSLLVNFAFAVVTGVKLPAKVKEAVEDVAEAAQTVSDGIEAATSSAANSEAAEPVVSTAVVGESEAAK